MKFIQTVLFVIFITSSFALFSQKEIFLDTIEISLTDTMPLEVNLEKDGFATDTCHRKGEELIVYLPVKNSSIFSVATQKKVTMWYDSGFYLRKHISGEPIFIDSEECKLIEIKVVPYAKETMKRTGLIPVKFINNVHPGIRVHFNLKYTQKVCWD